MMSFGALIEGEGWQALRYQRPLQRPLVTAKGQWKVREGYLLRAKWPDREPTFAEISPLPGFGGESLEAVHSFLLEKRPFHPGEFGPAETHDSDLPCSSFGWAMLADGAEDPSLPVFSSALLPAGEAALPVLEKALAKGFSTFKWKVGVASFAEEVKVWRDLLAMSAGKVRFRLDANQAWDTETFLQWQRVLTGVAELEYLEEPLLPGLRHDRLLAGIASSAALPLALDERLLTVEGQRFWLAHGWPGYWVVKPPLWGHPKDGWDQLVAAVPANRLVVSSTFETAIGLACLDRLARRLQTPTVHGLGVGAFFSGEIVDEPVRPTALESRLMAEKLWQQGGGRC